MNVLRAYDKKNRKIVYLNKFNICSIYKYEDNFIEKIIISPSDSISYILMDGDFNRIKEVNIDRKYFITKKKSENIEILKRFNLEKETLFKKNNIKIGELKLSYAEHIEKGKIIYNNIHFEVEENKLVNWKNKLTNES